MSKIQLATHRYLNFIARQDGIPEMKLEERLRMLFARNTLIESAYLCRIQCDSEPQSVALCLKSDGPIDQIVEQIGSIFSDMFRSSEHLDIISLTDEQVTKVKRVCAPFYNRADLQGE